MATSDSYFIKIVLDRISKGSGEWCCVEGLNLSTCSSSTRSSVRKHFEGLGHRVCFEKRMKSGQRLRGFWITRKGNPVSMAIIRRNEMMELGL